MHARTITIAVLAAAILTTTAACSTNQPASTTSSHTTNTNTLAGFTNCVTTTGTPEQQTAIKHITKLTGMNTNNPKAWTDWTGGIKHAADANIITAAFADCYKTKTGHLTVYTQDGHVAGIGTL